MIRRLLVAIALLVPLLAFSPVSEAQTETGVECTYASVITGCTKQIRFDIDLSGANTYSGVVLTPEGLREAECAPFNAFETACELGVLLCSTDRVVFTTTHGNVCSFTAEVTPNPQLPPCPEGFTPTTTVPGANCIADPAPVNPSIIPSFTG